MGKLTYDSTVKVDIEDRALAHVQLVVGTKLRRDEPFFFSWKEDVSVGGGRVSVWMHRNVTMVFKYHGSRQPHINRAWLDALMHAANQPSGLYVTPEPPASEQAPLTDTSF